MKFLLLLLMAATPAFAQIQLTPQNTVVFRDEVSFDSTETAAVQLIALDLLRAGRNYPIYLVLDTPGGSVMAGESFIEIAKTIPNLKTITIFAASMGSGIVEALPGDRLILESGILMFHRARGGIEGQFEDGEMESQLEFYKSFIRRMEARSAKRMGLTLGRYKQLIKDELWIGGVQSVVDGSADAVVHVACSKELIEGKTKKVVDFGFFRALVEYSDCPLLRMPKLAEETADQRMLVAFENYKQHQSRMRGGKNLK